MKIKTKTGFSKLTLDDLSAGEVFSFSDSSVFRMKTDRTDCDGVVCVELSSGVLEGFDEDSEVFRIEGSFVEG